MDLFAETNYKTILRTRIKDVRRTQKSLTLQKIARKIPIQYTYLSKTLNDEKSHLNEDHLFSLFHLLNFEQEEADYVSLLRALATSTNNERRSSLQEKLDRIRKARKIKANLQEFNAMQLKLEMAYLFDPLCLITNIALHIEEYFRHPQKLCSALGISHTRLQEVLEKLARLGFIEIAPGTFKICKILKGRFHYSTDHPLMRVHQNLLKNYSSTQLLKMSEKDKHSFMVTFTADEQAFEKITAEFHAFISRIEKIAVAAPAKQAYQLNFDLFKWLSSP